MGGGGAEAAAAVPMGPRCGAQSLLLLGLILPGAGHISRGCSKVQE